MTHPTKAIFAMLHERLLAKLNKQGDNSEALFGEKDVQSAHAAHRGHRPPGDGHRRREGHALPSRARPRRLHVLRRHRRLACSTPGTTPNPRQAPTRRGPPTDSAARRHRRGHLRRVAALAAGGARAPVHGHGPPGADIAVAGAPASRALGRAQEVLILEDYWVKHPELKGVPIYQASALAKRAMTVYQDVTSTCSTRT